MGLYYRAIPYTQNRLRNAVLQDVEELLYAMLKRDGRIRHPKLDYEMYVRRVQGRNLIDSVIKRKDKTGAYDIVAEASEADLRVDLANAQLLIHMRNGIVTGQDGRAFFEDKIFEVPLSKELINQRVRKPREMTWQEILRQLDQLRRQEEKVSTDIALAIAKQGVSQVPPNLGKPLQHLKDVRHEIRYNIRLLVIEQYMRPALSFGCLCFVLIGCPVGIWFSRSDYLSAFITCFVPILFIYYPLLLCGNNMAKAGSLTPAVALWIPNATMALIALPLYWRLLKH
jgi:lipopolysaccharide export system permease protein